MIQTTFYLFFFAMLGVSCSASNSPDETAYDEARRKMVELLRNQYGVKNEKVLSAMLKIRRHVFIPTKTSPEIAYGDHPWAIGYGQTISQPFIVAHMTEKMNVSAGDKILEIGTGSGYQAAVLAELGAEVYSIEIIPELAEHARKILKAEGYDRVKVLTGDGYKGWPEYQPFDAIIVTCAPEDVPKALVEQLAEGGRMIIPVGAGSQKLVTLMKKNGTIIHEDGLDVRFVPMVGGTGKETNQMTIRKHLIVKGRVQGVGFRMSALSEARRLNLSGWVRNLPDGSVEAEVEGESEAVEDFIRWCRQGPSMAVVKSVDITDMNPLNEGGLFTIRY